MPEDPWVEEEQIDLNPGHLPQQMLFSIPIRYEAPNDSA
jgi:hypothetical protein